jgi:hypothetical protein
MIEKINLLTHEMRKKFPNFCLQGELIAQGDECDDRWKLSIDENGTAHRIDIEIRGKKVTCPCCGEEFIIDEE